MSKVFALLAVLLIATGALVLAVPREEGAGGARSLSPQASIPNSHSHIQRLFMVRPPTALLTPCYSGRRGPASRPEAPPSARCPILRALGQEFGLDRSRHVV